MARPSTDKFGTDSPLSPMSAASATTPVSYSSNVNRQKTKKWVEAKPADYGGDDWGDEYDDYGPPPLSKPTGLRQPGQAAKPPSIARSSNEEGNKKAYRALPTIPDDPQSRSVSSPARERTNSFTKDDEHRAFSGGYAPRSAIAVAAPSNIPPNLNSSTYSSTEAHGSSQPVLHVSTQVPPVTGLRKATQPTVPAEVPKLQGVARADEPQSGTSSKYSEATSKFSEVRTPASDFQARRDFSPSAVPSPLQPQPRYSPAPVSATTELPSRFPPRKSSIGQSSQPDISDISQSASGTAAQKTWAEPRTASPGPTARSPTGSAKALPFVRPADIYKRIEEEREKERQSMDSGRPSMDSIVGVTARERSSSPSKPTLRSQSSSDSLGVNYRKGALQDSDVDSGRRLAPMLEPVRERKSEYGFDAYDPSLAANVSEARQEDVTAEGIPNTELDHDKLRHFSVSPKLPDLNRISGFGLDLFSQTKPDASSIRDSTLPPLAENPTANHENNFSLQTRPSFGFTSMVNQAFDSETPVSVPGSGVERTNSESTGTTDISPIMSRGLSRALTNPRGGGSDIQQTVTPSIAEVDEPESIPGIVEHSRQTPPDHVDMSGSEHQEIRPGHRRNISTPSPGNSHARTPNVETSGRHVATEELHVSPSSDSVVSPVEDDLPTLPRPFADREQSFRPTLPGGWVSYATTASDVTSERDTSSNQRSETPHIEAEASHTPVSPISEESDNEVDLAHTMTKRVLPHSALGAAAGVAVGGFVGATFGSRGRGSPAISNTSDISSEGPRAPTGSNQLPIPGTALAPIENPYSMSALDPRLQSDNRDRVSTLQVPSTQGPVSAGSSAPPTPPPKDTPADEAAGRNPGYFPPTAPLKSKTLNLTVANEGITPLERPTILPTLSTNTSPQDEESDKLRKEIVKSLSPTLSNADAGQRLLPPYPPEPKYSEDAGTQGTRESTYLPSEYDNYWESTDEAGTELEKAEEAGVEPVQRTELYTGLSSHPMENSRPHAHGSVVTAPQGTPPTVTRAEGGTPEATVEGPPLHSHRFSWEAGPEQVSSKAGAARAESVGHPASAISGPGTLNIQPQHKAINVLGSTPPIGEKQVTPSQDKQAVASQDKSSVYPTNVTREPPVVDDGSNNNHMSSAVAMAGIVGAGAATFAGHQTNQNEVPQRRLSLAEEKSAANVSTYAISPTPPDDEHPARTSLPLVLPEISASSSATATQTQLRESGQTKPSQRMSDITKIMQFRDILALQTPEQRIRAYNDTRNQFASMDTGLGEWLTTLSIKLESSGAETWASPANNVPKTQAQATSLQQPYYRQYLNASPTSAVPQASRSGTIPISGPQQGLSPAAGKSPGQQTPGKGKDRQHSAGIFGGKASKAGKGFLHKFRGSSGGDKNSPPLETTPATKPKVSDERRSSWSMSKSSLVLPRPIRTDTSSQHSRASTPTHQPPSRLGQEKLSAPNVGLSERSIWEAPVSAASTPSIPPATPRVITEDKSHFPEPISNEDRVSTEDARDTVAVPAPIGKHQPSWDPYNATPIAEEEGFQYEQQSVKLPPVAATPGNQLEAPPTFPVNTKSDRSGSGETRFYDAREEPTDSDDWILVSKDEKQRNSSGPTYQTGQTTSHSAQENAPPASTGQRQGPTSLQSHPGPFQGYQPQLQYGLPSGSYPQGGTQPQPQYPPPAGSQGVIYSQPLLQPPAGSQGVNSPQPPLQPPAGSQGVNSPQPPIQPPAGSQGVNPRQQQFQPSAGSQGVNYSQQQFQPSAGSQGVNYSQQQFQPPIGSQGANPRQQQFQSPVGYQGANNLHLPYQPPIGYQGANYAQQQVQPSTGSQGANYSQQQVQPPTGLQGANYAQQQVQPPTGSQGANYSQQQFQSAVGYQGTKQPQPPYQPPPGSQGVIQPQVFKERLTGPQPPTANQPPPGAQPPSAPPTGFRGRFIQHIRQRSSKDGNIPPNDQPPAQQVPNDQQQQQQQQQQGLAFETREPTRQSGDFVGLPPIRRSSTFGLGFRSKEPKERFPIDDDDEDDVQQKHSGSNIARTGNDFPTQNTEPRPTVNAASGGNGRIESSGEPSRYSFIEGQEEAEAAAQNQDRPTLSEKSSEYSQLSGFSPVSPLKSPPELPNMTNVPANTRPNVVGGSQGMFQQGYGPPDRSSEAAWRLNARPSQEQRGPPITSSQRSPSYEGQHPAAQPPQQRGLSKDGQYVRSSSESNQGYQGPLLSSGVFVPPARTGLPPQKQFEQPPSSAQRYPELFKPEIAKETSVDGLPATYYQRPISREDAFLPRQQTNEYQLPGVGPPPEQPRSGSRSRRNSALMKELGGRLSRSASRDRGSTRDDDTAVRPIESRDSQSKDFSTASIASEDTMEKKRRSGMSFLGGLRRESTGGLSQSRDSMVAHAPTSRADSFVEPQQPNPPLAPSDRKRSFFGAARGSNEDLKPKPTKLSRVSTSSAVAEQQGKKKRFSGLTGIFSRPTEQAKKDSSNPDAMAAQDPQNRQRPGVLAQGRTPSGLPSQGMGQDPRTTQGQQRAGLQGGYFPQQPPHNAQGPYQQNLAASPNGAYGGGWQPAAGSGSPQQFQSQQSTVMQGGRFPQTPPGINMQNNLGQQPPLQGKLPLQRPIPVSQSPQKGQGQPPFNTAFNSAPPAFQNSIPNAKKQDQSTGTRGAIQQDLSAGNYQQIPPGQIRANQQPSPMENRTSQQAPLVQSVANQQPLFAENRTNQQRSPAGNRAGQQQSLPVGSSQQSPPGETRVEQQQRASLGGYQQGPPGENRGNQQQRASVGGHQQGPHGPNQQQGQPMLNGANYQPGQLPPLQAQQQSQQQRFPPSPGQEGIRLTPSQMGPRSSQEGRNVLLKQPPMQSTQPQPENKPRKTSGLFSGLLGGRRSSAQQGQDPKAAAQQPPNNGPREPQLPQMYQPPPPHQQMQPTIPPQGPPQGTYGQGQERGRPLTQGPSYAQPPIHGAYPHVRGDGGHLAQTPYDPRGINNRPGPPGQSQPPFGSQGAPQSTQPQYGPGQRRSQDVNQSGPGNVGPSQLLLTPKSSEHDVQPGLGPYQNAGHSRKSSKALSTEDLLARSPARPQFGQQAPYQLSLPGGPDDDSPRDQPQPPDRNLSPEGQQLQGAHPPFDKAIPTERAIPTARPLNTQLAQPTLRHPMSPATYPLPADTLFSPVNPSAAQVAPPPPPKWPGQAMPSQSLDRSNTINTHISTVSQLSGQLHVPPPAATQRSKDVPGAVTPPSPQITPQITPERSPEQRFPGPGIPPPAPAPLPAPQHSSSVSPPLPLSHGITPPPAPAPAPAPAPLRRRVSQEEKILVEEGLILPGSASPAGMGPVAEADVVPQMSATSYPGQEWNPYGSGFEEWD